MTPPGWILTGIPFKPEKGPKMTPLAWGPIQGPRGHLGLKTWVSGHIWAIFGPLGPYTGYIGHLSRIWAYIPGIGPIYRV